MNVVICSADDRTVVEIDGQTYADSQQVLLFPIPYMVDAYRRANAHVTLASLPAGSRIH